LIEAEEAEEEAGEAMATNEENMIGDQGTKEDGIEAEEEEAEGIMALKEEKVIKLMLWVDCCHLFCGIELLN
jgi:hypothetical protein